MIPKDQEAAILRLFHAEKWRIGTIAHQLGIHHSAVARVLKEAGVPSAERAQRPSFVDPFLPFIGDTFKDWPDICASRVYQMVKDRGYPGRPDHFRHLMAGLRPRKVPEAFLRLRTLPGEQGQVDWGHFGTITIGKAERMLMAFVMVLSWCRMVFLKFYLDQKIPNLLRGHEDAFAFFGGRLPRVLLYDNPKTIVLERLGPAIRFHEKLLAFAAHYHYEPRPVAPRKGNQKGRVERGIRFVRTSFWPARKWTNLDDLNAQAEAWCLGVAADRDWVEDKTRKVRDVFVEEQPMLLPVPANPFPTDEIIDVSVGKTPYIRFDLNDYSVPHTLTRKVLTVSATPDTVRLLDGTEVVATHPRSYDRGKQVEDQAHIQPLVERKAKASQHRGLDRLQRAVPRCRDLMVALAQRGKNLGNATQTLLRYLDEYGVDALTPAVGEALENDSPHPASVRHILERERRARGLPAPLAVVVPDDPRVHDLVVRTHSLASYDPPPRPEPEPTSALPSPTSVPEPREEG